MLISQLVEAIKNKIEKALIEKEISKKDFLLNIGMSAAGYWQMLESNSMKVTTLLKISEVLKLPVSYLLPSYAVDILTSEKSNPGVISQDLLVSYIEELAGRLKIMEQEIADLKLNTTEK